MHIEIGKQLVPTVPVLLSCFFKYRRSGEANSCTALRDIYFLSCSQKNPPLFCVLHHINPVNIIPIHMFKMQFYDILLSKSFIYQQIHFVSVLENIKIYTETYYKCSYMFRSTTIIRELTHEPS